MGRPSKPALFASMKYPTKPYPHQLQALERIRGAEFFSLTMEMGTGKSFVIVRDICELWEQGEINQVLIIAPSGSYQTWKEQFNAHTPTKLPYSLWEVSANTVSRSVDESLGKSTKDKLRIIIASAESLSSPRVSQELFRFVANPPAKLYLVLDEFHLFKTPSASRTKTALKWSPYAKFRRILSGTPVNNSPFDLWAPYTFLSKDIFNGMKFRQFCTQYCEMLPTHHPLVTRITRSSGHIPLLPAKNPDGSLKLKNIEELTELINPHTFSVLKSQCLRLPDKRYEEHEFDLSEEQRVAYKELYHSFKTQLLDSSVSVPHKAAALIKVSQVISGFILDKERGYAVPVGKKNPKLLLAVNLVKRMVREGHSVIIWCRFQEEIQQLTFALAPIIPTFNYYGATKASDREATIKDFNEYDGSAILIGTAACGGVGLTLNKASRVIYYSNTYSYKDRAQSEDRCHRIGQNQDVVYIDLLARGTVDQQIVKALRNKKSVLKTILRGLK